MEAKDFKCLTFLLNGETYGVPVSKTDGVVSIGKIDFNDTDSDILVGTLNLKEGLAPVFDLRTILNMPQVKYDTWTCTVLIKANINNSKKTVGFIVDSAIDILDVNNSDVETHCVDTSVVDSQFVEGTTKVNGANINLLSVDKILGTKKIDDILNDYLKCELSV